MIKQGKVWGETCPLFLKNNVEIHLVNSTKGGFSSKHKHVSKYNMFYVLSGCLEIDIWKDYGLIDKTVLLPNESCIVSPGDFHMFLSRCDTEFIEIYWTELLAGDIIRENRGGKEPDAQKAIVPDTIETAGIRKAILT